MKIIKTIIRILLILFIYHFVNLDTYAQSRNRISIQVSPLLSYLSIEYGKYSFDDLNGIDEPKLGFSSTIKFERDINQLLTFSTGLFYELRKNSYNTGMIYDTSRSIIWYGDPLPYRYTSSRTFKFIGIPIGLGINYLKNSKLRVFQTFDIRLSYMLSAVSKGFSYYETGEIDNYEKNNADDRNDMIFSFSTSIGISQKISDKVSINFGPGLNYMVNNFLESSYSKEKFFDLKLDIGIVYIL